MSIYDHELGPLLCELARSMERLSRMHEWAEANNGFSGSGLTVSWAYGQHDAGFQQVREDVEIIVRERVGKLISEAISREATRAEALHRRVVDKMGIAP